MDGFGDLIWNWAIAAGVASFIAGLTIRRSSLIICGALIAIAFAMLFLFLLSQARGEVYAVAAISSTTIAYLAPIIFIAVLIGRGIKHVSGRISR